MSSSDFDSPKYIIALPALPEVKPSDIKDFGAHKDDIWWGFAGDVYTPITDEVIIALHDLRRQCGGRWIDVEQTCGVKQRVLRRIRTKYRPNVSMSVMDRLLRYTGLLSIEDLPWYTPGELQELGLWKKPTTGDMSHWVAYLEEKRMARKKIRDRWFRENAHLVSRKSI